MADDRVTVRIAAETAGATAGIEQVKEGLAGLAEAVRGPAELIGTFSSRMREGLELAGITYAIDKLRDFGTEMAEIGERALNTGYALGLTARQVGELQGMFTLAGGNADEAQRSLERLGLSVQRALENAGGPAATAFRNLGIAMSEVRARANDLPELLHLLTERAAELSQPLQRTALLHELIGRGFDRLVPLMRRGAEGWEELRAAAQDYAAALERNAAGEADCAERINRLKLDTQTLAQDGFGLLKPAIDASRDSLDYVVRSMDQAVKAAQGLKTELNPLAAAFHVVGRAVYDVGLIVWDFIKILDVALKDIDNFAAMAARPFSALASGATAALSGPITKMGESFSAAFADTWKKSGALVEQNAKAIAAEVAGIIADMKTLAGISESPDLSLDLEVRARRGGRPAGTERPGGRGGGRSRADDAEREAREEYEIFAAGERLKIQEAKGDADRIAAIYDEWLAEVALIYGRDSKQYLDLEREKVAAAQRAAAERLRAVAEEQRKEEALYRKTAKEAARQWKEATRQISDQLATFATDVLERTKTIGQAFAELAKSILEDFLKSTFSSLLGGSETSGGGLSSLLFGSEGLSGLLGLGKGGLFGALGSALGIGGAAQEAANVAAMWGGGGEAEVLAGMGGAGAGGGGLFSGLFSWLGSLFAFARGGIVPAAAGGWTVPQLGPSGMLAQVHSREMVLPENISTGLQRMIDGGGGGHTFNLNVQAWDGRSVMQAGPQIVAAINRAMRNGSMLHQPT
jgi:hypothetical protein